MDVCRLSNGLTANKTREKIEMTVSRYECQIRKLVNCQVSCNFFSSNSSFLLQTPVSIRICITEVMWRPRVSEFFTDSATCEFCHAFDKTEVNLPWYCNGQGWWELSKINSKKRHPSLLHGHITEKFGTSSKSRHTSLNGQPVRTPISHLL